MSDEAQEQEQEEVVFGKNSFPMLLYRVDPNPAYLKVNDSKEYKEAIEEGWESADNFTQEQLERCADTSAFDAIQTVSTEASNDANTAGLISLQNRLDNYMKATNVKIDNLQKQVKALQEGKEAPVVTEPEGETDASEQSGREEPADRYPLVVAEIEKMLEEDPDQTSTSLWTKEKKPDATVLSDRLDVPVSAEERDDIWSRYLEAAAVTQG